MEKIWALLTQIEDEGVLESIYWYVERLLVRKPPRR